MERILAKNSSSPLSFKQCFDMLCTVEQAAKAAESTASVEYRIFYLMYSVNILSIVCDGLKTLESLNLGMSLNELKKAQQSLKTLLKEVPPRQLHEAFWDFTHLTRTCTLCETHKKLNTCVIDCVTRYFSRMDD